MTIKCVKQRKNLKIDKFRLTASSTATPTHLPLILQGGGGCSRNTKGNNAPPINHTMLDHAYATPDPSTQLSPSEYPTM